MNKQSLLILVVCFFTVNFTLSASMICPPTKYIYCDDDKDDLNLTGKPTLFGVHKYFTPYYTDQTFTNSCNVGHIIRRWFLDLNNNGICEYNEPSCYQDIFIKEQYSNISITYPKDITVACQGDIPLTSPQITNGPCDLIGVSHTDQEFVLVGSPDDGCRKILRKFTVINWCDYDPNKPNQNTWTGTQVIKIVDKVKPQITACKDVTIGFNQGCKSKITISNKAIDEGACASVKLYWIVEVDLYADGINDFVFGNDKIGDFFLPQKNNDEEIKITLPGLYGNGLHKVTWKVKDSCGNLTSCSSTITTKDTNAPTPYCPAQVSVGVGNTGSVRMAASMFNFGSFDNCTAQQYIKTSFTENVADSVRILSCIDAGFQNLNVYFHDLAGNKNYCKVALTIYDNNGCQGTLTLQGRVSSPQNKPILQGKVHLNANEDLLNLYTDIDNGVYNFNEAAIYTDTKIMANRVGIESGLIDLEDYVMFRKYCMSIDTLTPFGYLAGDINDDGRANSKDLALLKEYIIKGNSSFGNSDWKFVPSYTDITKLTLKNYNPIFDTRKHNGSLDFIAIAKGDFTESVPSNVAPRNNEKINVLDNEIALINGEDYIPMYLENTLVINAMKLNINIDKSKIFSNHNVEVIGANGQATLYIFTDVEYNKNEPLFYVKADVYSQALSLSGYILEQGQEGKVTLQKANKDQINLTVYPNPASTFITTNAPLNSAIEIYNTQGKIVLTQKVNSYKSKIDVSGLEVGVYFVKEVGGNRSLGRFVRMR